MMIRLWGILGVGVFLLSSCSGSSGKGGATTADKAASTAVAAADPESVYGPLEVGAGYMSYQKVSSQPFRSPTHGNRWVEVYVNEVAYNAYTDTEGETEFPAGSIVVKTSFEDEGGKPGSTKGPIFVMQKRAPGYAPEHEDWWYAMHWEKPSGPLGEKLGGPVYWRGKSPKASYCSNCHDNYDKGIGGIPIGSRAWE